MSWGYFLDLNLTLPTSEWKRLARTKTGDHEIAAAWWGFKDPALAEMFTAEDFDRTTLGNAVATFDRDEAICRVETSKTETRLRLCALLDRAGDPSIAKSIAALVDAARAKAKGTLRLVNDGSYAGEDGVEITASRGALSRKRVSGGSKLARKLGTEIFGGADVAAPRRRETVPTKAKPLANTAPAKKPAAADADAAAAVAPPRPKAPKPQPTTGPAMKPMERWIWIDVDALFRQRPADAVQFIADEAEARSLVGSARAYKALAMPLFYLVENPKIDLAPLVPLLRQLCAFPVYDPDKLRQYEAVRSHATRLLARRQDPTARAVLDRFIKDFPAPRDKTYAVSLVEEMGRAATELRARELEPPLRALLDTLIPAYSPSQRLKEIASCVNVLDGLARVTAAKKRR